MNKTFLLSICLLIGILLNTYQVNAQAARAPLASGTSGVLNVSFTTANAGGIWDPENVLVVWVEDSAGELVSTLLCFTSNANNSAAGLSEWWSLIGSRWSDDYDLLNAYTKMSADGVTGATQVDGISSATRPPAPAYGYRSCVWGISENLNAVADGTYTVKMEIANEIVPVNTYGHCLASFDFVKGPKDDYEHYVTIPNSLPNIDPFRDIFIYWNAKPNALSSTELSKSYHVFPNPASSFVFVEGFDVQELELFSTNGKSVLKSKQKHISLASLPAATYIMLIKTGKGLVSKTIVKE